MIDKAYGSKMKVFDDLFAKLSLYFHDPKNDDEYFSQKTQPRWWPLIFVDELFLVVEMKNNFFTYKLWKHMSGLGAKSSSSFVVPDLWLFWVSVLHLNN